MPYESESGNITMALAGDALIQRRLACYREKPFLDLVKLMREADVAFANLEGTAHEYEGPPGKKTQGRIGGYWMGIHPKQLEDLRWMGVDMVSCANNHALDFGEWGLLKTIEHLDQVGIVHAGTGPSFWEAQSPAYLECAAGRVALISVTATFEDEFRAGEQTPEMKGRPGANCLGTEKEYVVTPDYLQHIRDLSRNLGLEEGKDRMRRYGQLIPEDTDTEFLLQWSSFPPTTTKFVLGEEFSVRSRTDSWDESAVLRQVREAARQAEWVIVSFHSHEYDVDPKVPASFAPKFARACIDNGAHVFAGHGPHYLQGIELYKGRPLFYSLGNFIGQLQNIQRHPALNYQKFGLGFEATASEYVLAHTANETRHHPADPIFSRSVLPVCQWKGGRLQEIRLYPLDLGYRTHWGARGRPILADPPLAREILEMLQQRSEPFGSQIHVEESVGVIRPGE